MLKRLFIIAFLLPVFAAGTLAQDLISVADLSKEAKNKEYIVVCASVETEYAKVHITNSVNISYKAFFKPGDIEGILVSNAEIEKIFGEQGVSADKTIVLYDEGHAKYATRLYWILKYMGAPKVKVLDGGLEAWKAGRKPVTKNPTSITKATFKGTANPKMIVNIDAVKASKDKAGTILVDVREVNEFKGLENKSKGHIPWAINLDHNTLLNANQTFKSKADLEKLYTAAGVTKDKTIILYCSTGVRAGKHYLALVNILNYPNVFVYDNGYNEWVAQNNPVQK